MNDDNLLLSIFVGVEGAHAFSAFMPSYFTVKKFAVEGDASKLRSGYVPALVFNLVLGGSVATLTKHTAPLVVSVLVSVFMIAMYEGAIGKVA